MDKCQGRDKEAVLLSLVRSNAERQAGELGRGHREGPRAVCGQAQDRRGEQS